MNIKSMKLGKIAFESGLIVFSVLLALFLNEYREQIKQEREKERALIMIKAELKNNHQTLIKWLDYHESVLKNFDQAVENIDQVPAFDSKNSFISQQMPEGLVQDLLDDSTWEAIKESGIASSFDIEAVFALSRLYSIQNQGVASTIKRLLNIMGSREAVREAEYKETLALIRNTFHELVAQEAYLIHIYEKTFEDLEKQIN